MSISNSDIIRDALDILTGDSQAVTVIILRPGKPAATWYATLTGLASLGSDATITVTDIRTRQADPPLFPGSIILDVNEILDLRPAQEGPQ